MNKVISPETLIIDLINCKSNLEKTVAVVSEIELIFKDQNVGATLNLTEGLYSESNAARYLKCSLSTLQKRRKA